MPCVYSPVDFSSWNIFSKANKSLLERIVLLHVFGERGTSAIFITNEDIVYGLGSNIRAIDPFKVFSLKPDMFGYLGIGETVHTNTPIEIPELTNQKIICFSSGLNHTLALSEDGDLWVWGRNNYHQIGNYHPGTLNRPFLKYKNMVKSISTGDNYSLILLNNNTVLHFGTLSTEKEMVMIPTKIDFDSPIKEISCGSKHAAVLDHEGNVYIWGDNSEGQMGHFGQRYCENPKKFEGKIEQIGCASTATFTLCDGQLSSYGCVGDICEFKSPVLNFTTTDQILCVQTSDGYFNFKILKSDKMFTIRPINVKGKNWQNVFGGQSTPQFIRKGFQVNTSPIIKKRDINLLYNNQEYSDLTFRLKDGDVFVHKLILKTFSEHFKTLDPDVELIDVQIYNPNSYRCFLKYIYTGYLDPLDTLELIELYGIAISYSDDILKEIVVHTFKKQLNNENITKSYESCKKFMYDELEKICQEYASCMMDRGLEGLEELAVALGKILLTPEIVSNTYKYARDANLIKLKDLCSDFAGKNWEKVVLSKSFERLSPQVRCDLMKDSATIKTLGYTDK